MTQAHVLVTVAPFGKPEPDKRARSYCIRVRPLDGTARWLKDAPFLQGSVIPAELLQETENTLHLFQSALASYQGSVPERAFLSAAQEALQTHATHLAHFFWGENVWGTAAAAWRQWWQTGAATHSFLVIELRLAPPLLAYSWETLLVAEGIPFAPERTAIVRARLYEKGWQADLGKTAGGVWLALVANPDQQVGEELVHTTERHMTDLMVRGWPVDRVLPVSAEPDTAAIARRIQELRRPVALFSYLGHGQVDANSRASFLLADAARRGQWVGQKSLTAAFPPAAAPAALLLLACALGQNQGKKAARDPQPVETFLDWARVVIAMQRPISINAAERFVAGFYGACAGHAEPATFFSSPLPLWQALAQARAAMVTGGFTLEAATPVLYSRLGAPAAGVAAAVIAPGQAHLAVSQVAVTIAPSPVLDIEVAGAGDEETAASAAAQAAVAWTQAYIGAHFQGEVAARLRGQETGTVRFYLEGPITAVSLPQVQAAMTLAYMAHRVQAFLANELGLPLFSPDQGWLCAAGLTGDPPALVGLPQGMHPPTESGFAGETTILCQRADYEQWRTQPWLAAVRLLPADTPEELAESLLARLSEDLEQSGAAPYVARRLAQALHTLETAEACWEAARSSYSSQHFRLEELSWEFERLQAQVIFLEEQRDLLYAQRRRGETIADASLQELAREEAAIIQAWQSRRPDQAKIEEEMALTQFRAMTDEEFLTLAENATRCKKLYRRLARALHPDRNLASSQEGIVRLNSHKEDLLWLEGLDGVHHTLWLDDNAAPGVTGQTQALLARLLSLLATEEGVQRRAERMAQEAAAYQGWYQTDLERMLYIAQALVDEFITRQETLWRDLRSLLNDNGEGRA